MSDNRYTTVTTREQVTEALIEDAYQAATGFFVDKGERIDWTDVWERLERYPLPDGTSLDLGEDPSSPALRMIQAEVRKRIREG